MAKLEPGIWEQLVNSGLRDALALQSDLVPEVAGLEPSESPARLAQYLAPLIERAMRALGDESPDRRLALANEIVGTLRAGSPRAFDGLEDDVEDPARLLLALSAPPPFGGTTPPVKRPYFPLAETGLLTNGPDEPRIGHELAAELATADAVDLICAFVRFAGVRILEHQIRALIERGGRLRVITTTYLESTERRAVDQLVDLGAEVKIAYEEVATRLHAKAWLFHRRSGYSTAYIGSSNLSKTALLDGLEWNVRVSSVATPNLVQKFGATFESYWQAPRFETYLPDRDRERLDRALSPSPSEAYVLPYLALDIEPRPLQVRILQELEIERERHGRWKNLVVAATGTGKTVIAALDYRRLVETNGLPRRTSTGRYPSLLFVAHRREILTQTVSMFRSVLRDGAFGELYVDGSIPASWTHVFASVQSLSNRALDAVHPRYFDVVVIDEFHHAAAPTYRRLLEHFRPALLLGLTATPERTDEADILGWFDGHMAAEVRLWEAIDEGELVPFQYFGVADDVPLAALHWSRGGYVPAELENVYTGNDARVTKVVEAIRRRVLDPARMRALGFCVSVAHARFMARRFNELGIRSVAITGGTDHDERDDGLRQLRSGDVNVIFSVDVFNEGVDLPEVDTVLFLRPTESATVFLQQLGRGLRRTTGKSCLTVLDFIGRQRAEFRFDRRFQAITGRTRKQTERDIDNGFPFLPSGCHIELDPVARDIVLENIRQAIGSRSNRLVEELRRLGPVELKTFLRETGSELRDLYRPGRSWTTLRRRAGFEVTAPGPDEDRLISALGRMLHVEDDRRLGAWTRIVSGDVDMTATDSRLAAMLHVDLWGADRKGDTAAHSFQRLTAHPSIVRELRELFDVLDDEARLLPSASLGSPTDPLVLHARYTQNEALAAIGASTIESPRRIREGVYFDAASNTDLFFVTLEKSERDYSPSTRYRDYAISPTLFHWESQSTTSSDSPTGRRYRSEANHPFLFVRKARRDDQGDAPAYTYLGPCEFVSSSGDRPIAITWRLLHAMPEEFFEQSSVAAV